MQVKKIIEEELKGTLENEKYNVDKTSKQARQITEGIKKKLKGVTCEDLRNASPRALVSTTSLSNRIV